MTLDGKIAIVTGAGMGIGRGVAIALAKVGADVAVLEADADNAKATGAEIEDIGRRSLVANVDVSDGTACDAAVQQVVEELGGVDILVNDAVPPWEHTPFVDQDEAIIRRHFEVGVMGAFYLMRAVHPKMVDRGGGSIINFGSWAGAEGLPGYAGYGAAKEGIRALTKCAAMEWGVDGIRVNNICPWANSDGARRFLEENPEGYAEQLQRVPMHRIGDCELDIGRTVVFLASDASSYMTANTLMVAGGQGAVR